MVSYLLARATEASTWQGFVALLTAAGVHLSPEFQNSIITAGAAVFGLIGALLPNKIVTDASST